MRSKRILLRILLIILILLISLPIVVYTYCELSLDFIARRNIPQLIADEDFVLASERFNRALWIFYTDDKEMKMEKIFIAKTIYQLTTYDLSRRSDNIADFVAVLLNRRMEDFPKKALVRRYAFSKGVSWKWTVDDCLNFLANNIYFGHGYTGLKSAAEGYFQKTPEDLSIDEISMLIATTRGPNLYNIKEKDERFMKFTERIKQEILQSKNWQ